MNLEIGGRAKSLLLPLVLLCCSGVANAQGWYLGGGAGNSRNARSCSNLNGQLDPGFSCSGNDASVGWKLFAGYEFSRYLAVEGSYVDLGEFTVSESGNRFGAPPGNTVTANGSSKPSGFSLDAVGSWPVNEQISLIGRAGIFVWTVDATVTTATIIGSATQSDKPTGTSVDFGVGVKYHFDKNLGLRAEFQRFANLGSDSTGKSDVYLISASLVYRFRSSFY